ncbi:hypothetical protein J1N35_022555 [Gossypium stocksii]|uniref:Uncharacterized protein n=1 Tax=Gossypium stocksii TaxID=47602 RepID=A0A9D4A3K7_9ROSI|nr:hypothetical protein J1N35_022555 [Gossypium stocksii]
MHWLKIDERYYGLELFNDLVFHYRMPRNKPNEPSKSRAGGVPPCKHHIQNASSMALEKETSGNSTERHFGSWPVTKMQVASNANLWKTSSKLTTKPRLATWSRRGMSPSSTLAPVVLDKNW